MTNKLNGGQTIMKSKGFTLIELAVVLAIIAILAAILTPLVTQYVDDARTTRAMDEARQIAQGVQLFQRDTGRLPAYASLTTTTTDLMAINGPGTLPTLTGTGWATVDTTGASVSGFNSRVNGNLFSLPTTLGTGRVNYRGPYTVTVTPDPWGYQYHAVVGTLPTLAAYVISPGPDGEIDTALEQALNSFAASDDDIVFRIR
jgi:prepilin-type N-terminal cleavage/methylation domain-containing protein